MIKGEGLSDFTDRTTFFENDSVYCEAIRHDSVVQHLAGTYSIDCETMELTIYLNDTNAIVTVKDLTDSTMEIENKVLSRIDRMIRY